MNYLFLCVHPDDLEFSCANLMHYLSQRGHQINILCLTKGEFGIFEPEWKGPRLAKIRMNELRNAAEINGISRKNVYFGEIIDGFVRYTRENIDLVRNWLNTFQPDILFAPEPYYTYYWHADHINSGRISYYLAKLHPEKLNKPIKALYFYTTSKPNFSWPFNDVNHAAKSLYAHQSQWWLLKWNKQGYPIEKHNFQKRKLGPWKYVERYRRVMLKSKDPKQSILSRGVIGLLSQLHVIDPPDSHFVVPDMNSPFGQQVKRLRDKYHFKD